MKRLKLGELAELIVIVIAELILQSLGHFTYVTIHSPTLPSLYLRHSSYSNPSVASPMSQLILQLFFCFSYVTSSSLNSPDEPPMINYCYTIFKIKRNAVLVSINIYKLAVTMTVLTSS